MLQYTVFVILAPVAVVLTAILAGYAWSRKETMSARPLAMYLVIISLFLIINTLELVTLTESATLFFAKLNYLCITLKPVAWLWLAVAYSRKSHWITLERIAMMLVVPLITSVLVWSTEDHGLIWRDYTFVAAGGFLALKVNYGPWFWAYGLYEYALLFFGAGIILREYYASPKIYRRQSLWMVMGALFPLILNLIYVFKLIPAWSKDYSPLAFALAGLAFCLGIFRYRLLTVMPIARAMLIDTMEDGMIVLDHEQRVLDMNPAAQRVLRARLEDYLGKPVDHIWQNQTWPRRTTIAVDAMPGSEEGLYLPYSELISIDRTTPAPGSAPTQALMRHYELRVTALSNRLGQPSGWLVLLHDITTRKQAELALEEANAELMRLNSELEERVAARTQALEKRANELEAITRVSTALRRAVTLVDLNAILITEIAEVTGSEAGAIFLLEDDQLRVAALHGLPDELMDLRHARCPDPLWQSLEDGQMQVRDLPGSLNGGGLVDRLAEGWAQLTVMPLQAGSRTLGTLLLLRSRPEKSVEYWTLTAIAEMGGNALQRVRMMEMLEQLVSDRTRALSTLYEVTTTTNEFLELDIILQRILEKALEVLKGRVGMVHLLEEDSEGKPVLRMHSTLGLLEDYDAGLTPLRREDAGPWQQVFERNEIVVLPETTSYPPVLAQQLAAVNAQAYVGVPVHAKGRTLGAVSVFGKSLAHFSAEDIALLAAIADHAGGAVENSQLRLKAEQAAVMDERQRLSRDLHDSVTQSLYSLVLFSEAARDALYADGPLTNQQIDKARSYLERLRDTSQQALRELRLLIYELRPLALEKEGLIGALRNRLEAVEYRAGLEYRLEVENVAELPGHVEVGLYGIAQEALNNVLKHSNATRVTVRFDAGFDQVELEVSDNGRGFLIEAEQPPSSGFGLASMRERAAALGGTLTIRSEIGRGTSILATLKREAEE